ncbi:hypothetical protein ACFRCW_40750 [Streptomyces sp. NPDC056653]|uniref:hypothetical protein n=1 Tax=Streptomyces sp. NPDC056653 TaxID=3345894 RepID=UPI00369EDC10
MALLDESGPLGIRHGVGTVHAVDRFDLVGEQLLVRLVGGDAGGDEQVGAPGTPAQPGAHAVEVGRSLVGVPTSVRPGAQHVLQAA